MSRNSLIYLLIGTLFFIFSNGNWIIPVMTWLSPILLLRYLKGPINPRKLMLLFLIILGCTKLMLNGIIPNDLGALTYILTFYYAILWFLPYWAHSFFTNRIKGFTGTLVFPTTWVSLEYLNTVFFGSWGSLAYTQYGDQLLMQLASFTGIWGIAFIILWLGSVVNWCWKDGEIFQRIKSKGWIYGVAFFGVLVYGGLRILLYSPQSFSESIVSFTPVQAIDEIVSGVKQSGFNSVRTMARDSREEANKILNGGHRSIFRKMDSITHASTKLILWPEATISVLEEQEAGLLETSKQFALDNEVYLMLGYYILPKSNSARKEENKAVFINPSGKIEFEYLKAYPVPGSPHIAGDGIIPSVNTSMGKIGSAICYDMDFTGLIHQAGRKKIDIVLVPAWDWKAIDPLHTHMAVFRAIENGFSMIRQTGEGLSIAVDPLGRTLARMDHFSAEDHVMVSSVPTKRYRTLYTLIGDSFAWLCMLFFIITLGHTLLGKNKGLLKK